MLNTEIWSNGKLVSLDQIEYLGDNEKDIAAVIVNRDRPDLTDQLVEQIPKVKGELSVDIFVVEMGSTKPSKYASVIYEDPDYRGKAYGHNVGVRYAKSQGKYKYYFIAMNDIIFTTELGLKKLVDVANESPDLGILSPTETDSGYAGGICKPIKGYKFHLVSQCNYLGLLIRSECINDIGFLNPDFKYCWGAIHELAYKLYLEGYKVAYCDIVQMKHFGGTTYGKVKNTISRAEYLKNAKTFAARYMVANYGKNWDKVFSKALPEGVRYNTYSMHRKRWEAALEPHERKLYNTDTKDRIDSLNPWYYPVKIGNRIVRPGIGSKQSPVSLIERAKYRKSLLVDEVKKRYNFKEKDLLDIASNCAYWSSFYAKAGAKSLTAIEGRLDYIKQGKLYWSENNFLDNYRFIHGNVLDEEIWNRLHNEKFDFTLCAGILYHIDDYERLLKYICNISKEAILIDTRVSDDEKLVQEPGGFCFDAIEQTSKKRIPTLKGVVEIVRDMGFKNIDMITINAKLPKGMVKHDNYDKGRRICLLCKR